MKAMKAMQAMVMKEMNAIKAMSTKAIKSMKATRIGKPCVVLYSPSKDLILTDLLQPHIALSKELNNHKLLFKGPPMSLYEPRSGHIQLI